MILHYLKAGYQKVKNALLKTRDSFVSHLRALFGKGINEDTLDQLEQLLYEADLGSGLASELTEKVRTWARSNPDWGAEEFIAELQKEILNELKKTPPPPAPQETKPRVILMVGVNGSGKTTSVAKLARAYQLEGKKVIVGAADTFRAAATEQLSIWAERLGIDCVKGLPKGDPAAVAFDTISAAKARGADIVLIDTAGRLQNKTHLLEELEKVRRTCDKVSPGAPHDTFLTLDATTGQSAIDQATTFHKHTPLTGLIVTKLDGSAKGGIVVQLHRKLQIPILWVGTGEKMEDLAPFDAEAFAAGLFSQ